ncbi:MULTISPECIES: hypothetical protein [unclassified Bradyrhizobium]|uniref:hypothetical protein n=1 Tax=unclassified Bradyrhizobium TaxID=2631580 RepID=UPI00339330AB
MNRHERRIEQSKLRRTEAKLRRQRRDIALPRSAKIAYRNFLDGVSLIIGHIRYDSMEETGGLCLYRCLVGLTALKSCGIDGSLHIGSLVCRVGPDERRDVVAFCGPQNAGYGRGYHAWIEIADDIIDFSVGDWSRADPTDAERSLGLDPWGPVQWTVTLPSYWCKPRDTLVDPWRPVGTPALGEAWYGPYDDDAMAMYARVREALDHFGPQIADAIDTIQARYAAEHGLQAPTDKVEPLGWITPIIESRIKPTAAPPGMIEMKLSEIFRLAGASLGNVPDAVAYVRQRPTTPAQAREMLMNMTITAGR